MLPSAPSKLPPRAHRTVVLGVGNILLRDEGVGVRVIHALQRCSLPGDVELIDGGTSGMDLLDVIADCRRLIIIDAIESPAEPASVFRLTDADLAPRDARHVSLHDLGLVETLTAARLIGAAPQEVIIFGVKPADLGYGLELSEPIAALVPELVEMIREELCRDPQAHRGAQHAAPQLKTQGVSS